MNSARRLLALLFAFTLAAPGGVRAVSTTPTPTLSNPATNERIGDNSPLNYTLPVAALAGSATLTFDNGSGTPTVFTIGSSGLGAGFHPLPLKLSNPTLFGTNFIASVSGPAITDGTYSVTLSYQDTAGDPAASATSTGVIVDTAAQTPTLAAPVRFGKAGRSLAIDFTLPEAAFRGSVQLTFYDTNNSPHTIVFAGTEETAGQHTFTIDPTNPTASAQVASGAAIPDGSYIAVALEYNDLSGNRGTVEFVKDVDPAFIIDTSTQAPTLTKPLADAISLNPMPVEFTLPEAALAGSVTVKFDDGTNVRTLHIKDGVTSLSFEVGDPGVSPDVTSVDGGDDIPDGTYTVTLSYQDALGNPANTAAHTGVVVDGTAPQISIPTVTLVRRQLEGVLADYTGLAQVTDAHPGTVTQEPAAGENVTATLNGSFTTITLTATDLAGNDSSVTFNLDVRPLNGVSTVLRGQGNPAPGAGVFPGLPADAKLVSFGTPAISDDGHAAFVAKWASAGSKTKGSGLFFDSGCVALVGGDASAVGGAGATWKSFSDPVTAGINFQLVCIAKLSTGASAVVGKFTGAALEKIALTGEQAPDVGDAKFKSFKNVALHGGSVGFLATLTGGTGVNKITPANDTGLWARDTGGPLQLLFRDSFNLDGTHIVGSFVSFAPGSGSPGQGRGWLSQNVTPPNTTTLALTLNTFIDKSKGIGFGGFGGYTFFTRSGETGTSFAPALAGANFDSFRLPAMNDALQGAFYATMKAGAGGVVKADASAIFAVDADFSGPLAPPAIVARVGRDKDGGTTGAKFAQLKDPVLSQDGDIAFPATMNTKGPGAQTLWWKPMGGALALLAQGGGDAGDLAGAKFKTFTSLAIAGGGRGPIFAATLVPNQTNVTAASASGVWACDFTGAVRTLFRTGDMIGGKTVKSFTLLKAAVGSTGVTRSFNDVAQVVWLATFTDKSQAIVTTEVP